MKKREKGKAQTNVNFLKKGKEGKKQTSQKLQKAQQNTKPTRQKKTYICIGTFTGPKTKKTKKH